MDFIKSTLGFTGRNIRLFFKDRGLVLTALISPLIVLVLYILFLHGVFRDSFVSSLGGMTIDDGLINGYIAGYEVSSILAVCGVTVAFIANMTMVDDRVSGVSADLLITPCKKSVLTLGYYLATAAVTLVICYIALAVGLIYIAIMGWHLTAANVFGAIFAVLLTSLFGTALSSIVCTFLKSRGAITAVSTVVSSVYGFICGAYYPISQFAKGIADIVMCMPGTYFTGLLHHHFLAGYSDLFLDAGLPDEAVTAILDSLDANMYFFDNPVPVVNMYIIAACTVVGLIAAFVVINLVRKKHKNKV